MAARGVAFEHDEGEIATDATGHHARQRLRDPAGNIWPVIARG